jgi:hypothetical protein
MSRAIQPPVYLLPQIVIGSTPEKREEHEKVKGELPTSGGGEGIEGGEEGLCANTRHFQA